MEAGTREPVAMSDRMMRLARISLIPVCGVIGGITGGLLTLLLNDWSGGFIVERMVRVNLWICAQVGWPVTTSEAAGLVLRQAVWGSFALGLACGWCMLRSRTRS